MVFGVLKSSRLPWFVMMGYLPLIVCLTASSLSWFGVLLDAVVLLPVVVVAAIYGIGHLIYTIDECGTDWFKSVSLPAHFATRYTGVAGVVIAYCVLCVVLAFQSPANVTSKDGLYYALEQRINPTTFKQEKRYIEITKAQYSEAKPRDYRAVMVVLTIFTLIFGMLPEYCWQARQRFAARPAGDVVDPQDQQL